MIRTYGEEMIGANSSRSLNESSKLYRSSKYLGHLGNVIEMGSDTYNNFSKDGLSARAVIATTLDYGQMILSGWVSSTTGTIIGGAAGAGTVMTIAGAPVAPVVAVSTGVAVDYGLDSLYDNHLREPAINGITYTYTKSKEFADYLFSFND